MVVDYLETYSIIFIDCNICQCYAAECTRKFDAVAHEATQLVRTADARVSSLSFYL